MAAGTGEPDLWRAGEAATGSRIPLWATAVTVALFVIGFRPGAKEEAEARYQQEAPTERGRGRGAAHPAQIPPRGWKDVLIRVKDDLSKNRVVAVAAGIAFYALLAIFPAIAALVALYGLFANPATVGQHLDTLGSFIPGSGMDLIRNQIDHVIAQGNQTLGLTFIIGLAASLWSSNAGTKALFDALNVVYEERERRNFFRLNAASLLFTFASIIFLLTAIGALVVLPAVLGFIGLGGIAETLLKLLRWPLLFGAIVLALAFVYRYGPSREKPQWRWVTPGSVAAALIWIAASILFSWYAESFGNYNKTYGSLGAVIIFMTWIWISALAVLIGAELDAEMEHQTAQDTTTGRPKPLGQRGASMADTVGRASGK